jgi:hypothetical protein
MNYTEVNLDLQGVAKRIYDSLLYRSAFYKMLNPNYIGELRTTGTPMIEILKSTDTSVNVRETKEIASALTPALQGYSSVKVDLTELPMDYSIRIPVLVGGTNFTNTIEDAMDKKDQAVTTDEKNKKDKTATTGDKDKKDKTVTKETNTKTEQKSESVETKQSEAENTSTKDSSASKSSQKNNSNSKWSIKVYFSRYGNNSR